MLKKSPFLTYVLSKTSALAAQDGKKAQNSNYFLAALYELMDSYAAGAHFEEAATPEGKKELENTYLTLSSYGKAFDEKREAILAFIHAEGYSSMSDDLLFGMFSYKAESHAKKNGKELVDTPSYIAVVMAEPTAAIKKCVLGIADAPKAEEKSGISDALRDTIKELYTEEDEDETAETPEKEEAKPQKKDGKQHLSESVAVARKTRDALLSKIFGQDVAVATFVSGYFQSELMAHTRAGGHKPAHRRPEIRKSRKNRRTDIHSVFLQIEKSKQKRRGQKCRTSGVSAFCRTVVHADHGTARHGPPSSADLKITAKKSVQKAGTIHAVHRNDPHAARYVSGLSPVRRIGKLAEKAACRPYA